jgi:hypothetical protein
VSLTPNLEGLSAGITKVAGVVPGHAARTARAVENSYNNPLGLLDWLLHPVGAGVAATNVTGRSMGGDTESASDIPAGSTSRAVNGTLNNIGTRSVNSFYNRIQNASRNLRGAGSNVVQAAPRVINSVNTITPAYRRLYGKQ